MTNCPPAEGCTIVHSHLEYKHVPDFLHSATLGFNSLLVPEVKKKKKKRCTTVFHFDSQVLLQIFGVDDQETQIRQQRRVARGLEILTLRLNFVIWGQLLPQPFL